MPQANGSDETAVLARIEGRVQGVFFRAWTQEQASSRGLRGWVRNRRDGSVEAHFEGPEAMVDAMLAACREGPPAARVDDIQMEKVEPGAEAGFHQLPTA